MRFDPVAQWAARTPSRVAIRQRRPGALAWSYAELHARIDAVLRWLREQDVAPGDRVALLASNRVDCLLLAFAAWRLGATVVPLNWRLAPPELARLVAHATPHVVLFDDQHQALAEDTRQLCGVHTRATWWPLPASWSRNDEGAGSSGQRGAEALGNPDAVSAVAARDASAYAHPDAHRIAMLLYTSGSTGLPKGVMITHAQLEANARCTIAGWALHAEDRALVATPLFHTAGWHAFTTPVLAAGGTVVLDGDFDADHFMTTLASEAITRVFVVPTQLLMVQRSARWGAPLPALRQWLVGGAPCPRPARDAALHAGYPVVEAYGLTEFGPNCFVLEGPNGSDRPGTVGHPLPGLEARVVDHAEMPLAPGAVGALQLRGAPRCSGYLDDPAATAALFAADGWVRTGDLASIDARGIVRIAGRIKELFISGGEHVHPGEVERTLREFPVIDDAVVVAVPDPWWGEVGCAVIVSPGPFDVDGLVRHLRQALAGYKVPRYLWTVDAFPLLGSGKIDRARVAELARAALLGEDSSMVAIPHDAGRR